MAMNPCLSGMKDEDRLSALAMLFRGTRQEAERKDIASTKRFSGGFP
jgi:hypothetical protein